MMKSGIPIANYWHGVQAWVMDVVVVVRSRDCGSTFWDAMWSVVACRIMISCSCKYRRASRAAQNHTQVINLRHRLIMRISRQNIITLRHVGDGSHGVTWIRLHIYHHASLTHIDILTYVLACPVRQSMRKHGTHLEGRHGAMYISPVFIITM